MNKSQKFFSRFFKSKFRKSKMFQKFYLVYYHFYWSNKENTKLVAHSIREIKEVLNYFNTFWANSLYGNITPITSEVGDGVIYLEHGWVFSDANLDMIGYEEYTVVCMNPVRRDALKAAGFSTLDLKLKTYIEYTAGVKIYGLLIDDGSKSSRVISDWNYKNYVLLMPRHSTYTVTNQTFSNNFYEYLKNRNHDHAIVVVLHPFDFNNKKTRKIWLEKGYTVVCCGNITSVHFLENLSYLMRNSQFILSDGVGTHIYYAAALNKEIYFYEGAEIHLTRSSSEEAIYSRDAAGRNIFDRMEINLLRNYNFKNYLMLSKKYPLDEFKKTIWDSKSI